MEITKQSNTEIKISKNTDQIISLNNLLTGKSFLEKEIQKKQNKLTEINFLISEAIKLGVSNEAP